MAKHRFLTLFGFIVLYIMVSLSISGCKKSHNGTSVQNYNKEMINITSENVLKRRYGEFSTAGAFILVCIRNEESGKKTFIVCENTEWYLVLRKEKPYPVSNEKEYLKFMLKKHNKCIDLPNDTFNELFNSYGAPIKDEYEIAKEKGIPYIISTYFRKWYWNYPLNTGRYEYFIREQERYASDRSFIRMLLELGLVVRRDCESGEIYIESDEIDYKR